MKLTTEEFKALESLRQGRPPLSIPIQIMIELFIGGLIVDTTNGELTVLGYKALET